MADPLTLSVVTPEEVFFEGPVVSVVAPGGLGYLGILKDHTPLVTTLTKGKLSAKTANGDRHVFKVENGFLEVRENRILVLTDKVLGDVA